MEWFYASPHFIATENGIWARGKEMLAARE
jgi:hypothetical protein